MKMRTHILLLTAFLALSNAAQAETIPPQSFATPDAAAKTLVEAVRAHNAAAVLQILGEGARDLISSGDPVADENVRDTFLKNYDAGHTIAGEAGGGTAILNIGAQGWPFPIPIVHNPQGWAFDADAGRQEILFRRIGRNELNTIQTCLAYVDAQGDYADYMARTQHKAVYAQKIVSTSGKKDGLYWPTASNEPSSPLGELAASASAEGYKAKEEERIPYHGYYFKILTKQGANAPGGVMDYIVDGQMIGGFALIAWPATYGNSGIMSFITNYDGAVYQKDLGDDTAKIAEAADSFDPDSSWTRVSRPGGEVNQ